jgi:hypothetical protein
MDSFLSWRIHFTYRLTHHFLWVRHELFMNPPSQITNPPPISCQIDIFIGRIHFHNWRIHFFIRRIHIFVRRTHHFQRVRHDMYMNPSKNEMNPRSNIYIHHSFSRIRLIYKLRIHAKRCLIAWNCGRIYFLVGKQHFVYVCPCSLFYWYLVLWGRVWVCVVLCCLV